MNILDRRGISIAQLTADGRLLDWRGQLAGHLDDKTSTLTVEGIVVDLMTSAHSTARLRDGSSTWILHSGSNTSPSAMMEQSLSMENTSVV